MKPKYYITSEQRSGTINGFNVDDYRMVAKTEEEVTKLEGMPQFKNGMIKPYIPDGTVKEKSFFDTVFSADEQDRIKELLTPAEIKDALNLLIEGKKEKQAEKPKDKEVTIATFTVPELKQMLSEKQITFAGNASKEVLFKLYQESLEKSE